MNHKIAVIGNAFDKNHIAKIETAAAQCGCQVVYHTDNAEAIPCMADIDIVFGPSDGLSVGQDRLTLHPTSSSSAPHSSLPVCVVLTAV